MEACVHPLGAGCLKGPLSVSDHWERMSLYLLLQGCICIPAMLMVFEVLQSHEHSLPVPQWGRQALPVSHGLAFTFVKWVGWIGDMLDNHDSLSSLKTKSKIVFLSVTKITALVSQSSVASSGRAFARTGGGGSGRDPKDQRRSLGLRQAWMDSCWLPVGTQIQFCSFLLLFLGLSLSYKWLKIAN